jgi:hypothetical protein
MRVLKATKSTKTKIKMLGGKPNLTIKNNKVKMK